MLFGLTGGLKSTLSWVIYFYEIYLNCCYENPNYVIQCYLIWCSPDVEDSIGLGSQGSNGFIAADFERSSLVLCGKAFTDSNGIKETLSALTGPIISARGGLPLSARQKSSSSLKKKMFLKQSFIKLFTSGSCKNSGF